MAEMYMVLEKARSPDDATRNTAEQLLVRSEAENAGNYFLALSEVLKNEAGRDDVRQLAALKMKVSLDSKDVLLREQRQARWLSVPIPQKELIKNNVTATLGAAGELARRAAVQVIAKLGYLEITPADNKWPTLLPGLISFAVNEAYPAEARSSALTALSFLLEELDAYDESPLHQSTVDSILTAICQNMALAAARALQVAATRAMLTALPFVATNFDDAGRVNERNAIMMAMCTSTTSDTADVKHTAFLCIEKTAELYYEHLGPYMKVLADLTAAGARSTDEAVAVTALGFWSEIASWEVEHPEKSQKYVKGALAPLISMVTEIMSTSVEELDDDVDADVVAEAAQAALQSFACVVQDDIVQPIMDFMNANFNNPDFKKRDAAVMAFGCILEGPNAEVLRTRYIGTILPYLIDRIQGGRARDPSARVRQSIGFALAEIFGNHFEVVDLEKHFIPLMQALCAALDDSPGVATQILRAIDNMVTSGQSSDGWLIASPSGGEANALSPLLFESIKAIIMRGDRPDASEGLRTSCYEAISTMVENASPADSVVLLNLMQNAVQRIVASLAKYQAATSKEEREGELVMQDALVGLVTSVCLCVGEEALPQGDAIMSAMLHCIGARTSPSEAWRAIGALSSGMKPATDGDTSPAGSASAAHVNILRYIEPMWPMLIATLSNPAEVSPCYTALLATSSIVTALGGLVEQRASELLAAVLRILSDEAVDRDLKPPALVILGDVSLRLGASISVYLPNMHALILGASQVAVDKDRAGDEDYVQYVEEIRDACLEAWQGIIACVSPDGTDDPRTKALKQAAAVSVLASGRGSAVYADILAVICKVWYPAWLAMGNPDELPVEQVVKAAEIIGDIALAVGPKALQDLNVRATTPEIAWILNTALQLEKQQAAEQEEAFSPRDSKAQFAWAHLPK